MELHYCDYKITFFKRPTKSGEIYYFRYRKDERDSKRSTAKSTGATNQSIAKKEARKYIDKLLSQDERTLFKDYVKDWWFWDRCRYVLKKRSRGKRIGETYVKNQRKYLENYIIPYFGEMPLSDIGVEAVEDWQLRYLAGRIGVGGKRDENGKIQKKHLSATTQNQILANLKIIFKEAVYLGHIDKDPTLTIEPKAEKREQKGILSKEEIRALFLEQNIPTVWENHQLFYSINLLSASTGLRMGECQGLTRGNVFPQYVTIEHAWVRQYGLREPKWGSFRSVPIPRITAKHLQILMDMSPYQEPEDLVFFGTNRYIPIDQKAITRALYNALVRIGIKEEERQRRNITFHSWRHFYNSYLRLSRIPDVKTAALTGHRTKEMQEHYTHIDVSDYQDVLEAQEDLFHG